MQRKRFLVPAAGLALLVGAVASGSGWAEPAQHPAAPAVPAATTSAADCGPGATNPTTDNVTDYRPIAEVYTVPDAADGRSVRVTGSFTSPGGRFRVLLAHDGDPTTTAGPFTEL